MASLTELAPELDGLASLFIRGTDWIVFDPSSQMDDGVRFALSLEHMGRLGLLGRRGMDGSRPRCLRLGINQHEIEMWRSRKES